MNKIVDDNFLKNDLGLIGVDYYIMRNYLGLDVLSFLNKLIENDIFNLAGLIIIHLLSKEGNVKFLFYVAEKIIFFDKQHDLAKSTYFNDTKFFIDKGYHKHTVYPEDEPLLSSKIKELDRLSHSPYVINYNECKKKAFFARLFHSTFNKKYSSIEPAIEYLSRSRSYNKYKENSIKHYKDVLAYGINLLKNEIG